MGSRYYWPVVILATLASHAVAQRRSIIPQDLQAGFVAGGDEVQVSYTNQAVDGFEDGTVFEKNAVTKEPTFALGDSNGISPTTLYTIIMVDTTCPNARRLHYARANFKNNFDITNIATDSPPILDYIAPGSVGEKGDNRQYSFLMYLNPGRQQINNLKLPGKNEAFNVKKFQDDNGLQDALAGVGMVVKLGGEANCEGGGASEPPSNSPTTTSASGATRPASRTSAATTSSAAASTTRTADTEVPQSTVAPSPTASGSGGQRTSTSASPPRPSRSPANSAVSSPVALSSETPASPGSPETPETSEAPVPSGIATVPVPNSSGAGTATSTANPVEQTANAATGGFRNHNCEIVAFFMALGVLAV